MLDVHKRKIETSPLTRSHCSKDLKYGQGFAECVCVCSHMCELHLECREKRYRSCPMHFLLF